MLPLSHGGTLFIRLSIIRVFIIFRTCISHRRAIIILAKLKFSLRRSGNIPSVGAIACEDTIISQSCTYRCHKASQARIYLNYPATAGFATTEWQLCESIPAWSVGTLPAVSACGVGRLVREKQLPREVVICSCGSWVVCPSRLSCRWGVVDVIYLTIFSLLRVPSV